MIKATSTSRKDPIISVYETISDLIVERYGVHFSKEGEQRARKSFSDLCAKSGEEEVLEALEYIESGCFDTSAKVIKSYSPL